MNLILMRRIRVIIIEDEFFVANHLKDLVEQLGFSVVGVYYSGEQFLRTTDWQFDAAVVDIFLSQEMTGLDVAVHLNERQIPFLFLTANKDSRTLNLASKLQPRAYLSKPFNPNDVSAALQMISFESSPLIEVRSAHGIEGINANAIYYIKSDGAYIELHTDQGRIIQRKLLKEIGSTLPDFFVRVHRSYIVNTHYLEQRSSSSVVVHGTVIPISKGFREQLDV